MDGKRAYDNDLNLVDTFNRYLPNGSKEYTAQ